MKSTYRIVWSDEALHGLSEIIHYLETNFSEKEVKNFAKKFHKQIFNIQNNPTAFPIKYSPNLVRRALVAKLTSIYFQIEENDIRILSVFDNRKNPERLNL